MKERSPPAGVTVERPVASTATAYRESASDARRELIVRRRWRPPPLVAVFMGTLLAGWNGTVLIFGVFLSFAEITAAYFPLGMIAAASPVTYFFLAMLLNTSTVRVDAATLSVRHGPIPWWGERQIPIADIDRVDFRELRDSEGGEVALVIASVDGVPVKLLDGLTGPQAEHIASILDEHLRPRAQEEPSPKGSASG